MATFFGLLFLTIAVSVAGAEISAAIRQLAERMKR